MRLKVIPKERPGGRWVLTGSEMKAADAYAIESLGIPGVCLMENAGRHLARVVAEFMEVGARCALLCGPGNNGGDGFVAARHLQSWGFHPDVFVVGDPSRIAGDAAINFDAFRAMGNRTPLFEPHLLASAAPYPVIVDALLGTGLSGDVRAAFRGAIDWMNGAEGVIVAADIPSGVCSETGRVLGTAAKADVTVTFATAKCGHLLHPGADYVGRLDIVDIGMPQTAFNRTATSRQLLGSIDLAPAFTKRRSDAHKGRVGHVYILGGSGGRAGAALMAAHAAMRAGAGLVTIGTTEAAFQSISAGVYEGMCEVALTPNPNNAQSLIARLKTIDAVLIGPGFPTEAGYGEQLLELLADLEIPHVVDADGLNHMARLGAEWSTSTHRIVTPHPGEAGRLLGLTSDEVQVDRLGSVQALCKLTKGVAVLKGAHTVICANRNEFAISPVGNPGMASAGMGDVLGGITTALLARGMSAASAAKASVYWHGCAGDVALKLRTENALLARDVIACLEEVERDIC